MRKDELIAIAESLELVVSRNAVCRNVQSFIFSSGRHTDANRLFEYDSDQQCGAKAPQRNDSHAQKLNQEQVNVPGRQQALRQVKQPDRKGTHDAVHAVYRDRPDRIVDLDPIDPARREDHEYARSQTDEYRCSNSLRDDLLQPSVQSRTRQPDRLIE